MLSGSSGMLTEGHCIPAALNAIFPEGMATMGACERGALWRQLSLDAVEFWSSVIQLSQTDAAEHRAVTALELSYLQLTAADLHHLHQQG